MQIHQLRMIVLCFLFQRFAGVRKKIVIKLREEYPHACDECSRIPYHDRSVGHLYYADAAHDKAFWPLVDAYIITVSLFLAQAANVTMWHIL